MTKYLLIFVLLCVPQFAGATQYFVDFQNGNDTHSGLKEGDYTADVGTADVTIVDTELSSAVDSAYVGDFIYNKTRNATSTVTVYVGATKTMTISPAITGQTNGDTWQVISAFQSLNQFANNARSAGDIATVRRGMASTTAVAAVTFTSDGTLNQPITVQADYDNHWFDNASTSATWTPTFGSKFVASSASSTEFTTPNKWIYLQGDCAETYNNINPNTCEYAYEVASTSPNGIDLFLPYKGNQTGSGVNMRIMRAAPQIGTVTEANQIFTNAADNNWIFKGLDLRSTSSNGPVSISTVAGVFLVDMVIQSDGITDAGITSDAGVFLSKVRFFGGGTGGVLLPNTGLTIQDFLIDCNNVAGTEAVSPTGDNFFNLSNGEVDNCTTLFRPPATTQVTFSGGFSNVKNNNLFLNMSGSFPISLNFQDSFGVVGLNSQTSNKISANTLATTTMSTTTSLRSGGGPSNLYVFPPSGAGDTGISTKQFPLSYIKLFEYPIYTDTSSKTYTMYFRSASSSSFTVDPLTQTAVGSSTPELYIECEYYNDATDADRMLKRSNTAADADLTGNVDWQDISVTCQPTQAGVLYLRGWYAKPREASTNQFYMDTTPEII